MPPRAERDRAIGEKDGDDVAHAEPRENDEEVEQDCVRDGPPAIEGQPDPDGDQDGEERCVRPGSQTGGIVLLALVVVALALAAMRGVISAGADALSADRVLGQIDFIKNAVNFVDPIGMDAPAGVTIDQSSGQVLVADTQNNRVLGWKSAHAFASGGPADLVIGQPDFHSSGCNQNAPAPDATGLCGPIGVAVDVAHRVLIGDTQNNRVEVFADPFAALLRSDQATNFAADAVFGQSGSFTTNAANEGGLSADSLNSPQGVAFDGSGNLFVADVNNNRALVYFSPFPMMTVKGTPGSFGDATADVAVGQPDLFSGACNQGGIATLSTLCLAPFLGVGIAVDTSANHNLYVADTRNNRALEYNGPFGFEQTNNLSADLVFQGNNLALPSGLAVDSSGNFYVSSEQHNQLYEYTQPVPLMRTDLLNLVIGGAPNPTAHSLQFPMGLAIDAVDNLYVADQANNRVLLFDEGVSPGNKVANGAGGQIDEAHDGRNFVDATGQNAPGGIAVDASSNPPHRHLYVADSVNNRVLGWNDVSSFTSALPANIVFGQPDLFSNRCNNGVAAAICPDSAPTACAIRSAWRSIKREICTWRIRATIECSFTIRRSTRPAASRARATVGGFRLWPGGRIHVQHLQSQRRQCDDLVRAGGGGAGRRRQRLYCGHGEQSRARVREGGQPSGGVGCDCESIVWTGAGPGFLRHAMRRPARLERAVLAAWRSTRRGIYSSPTPATTG